MTDQPRTFRDGDELPVELRYFTMPDIEEPVSGRELLEDYDHDRALVMLLRTLQRGQTGRTPGHPEYTRIW